MTVDAANAQPSQLGLMRKLEFNQAICAAPGGKSITTSELLKRLKSLHYELKVMEQENTEVKSFNSICHDLTAPSLLHHKDKSVKTLVACCWADLLRLYAPNAPITVEQQKTLFAFLLAQLQTISDPAGPNFAYAYYLLEMLANVKSLILIIDLDNADQLIGQLFQLFFGVIRDDHPKAVAIGMLDILHQMVEEVPALKHDVVTTILQQFTKSTRKRNPAAHQLACELVKSTQDRLQHYICQHFNDVLLSSHREDNQKLDSQRDDELADLVGAHELIYELHLACDGVLLSVVPQLETELNFESCAIRQLAISLLGRMFSERGSLLSKNYLTVWKSWLTKRNDPDVDTRILWLQFVAPLITTQGDRAHELGELLCKKLQDPEERVRVAAVLVVRQLAEKGSVEVLDGIDVSIVTELGHRTCDKKLSVRSEAITTLAMVYHAAYDDLIHSAQSMSRYGAIPSVLTMATLVDLETSAKVEQAFDDWILPPVNDAASRASRFMLVLAAMPDSRRKILVQLVMSQYETSALLLGIVDRFLAKQKARAKVEDLSALSQQLCSTMPESVRFQITMEKLSNLTDMRLMTTLKQFLGPDISALDIFKLRKDLTKKFESLGLLGSTGLVRGGEILLRRCSRGLFSSDMVPFVLSIVNGTCGEEWQTNKMALCATWLVKSLSKQRPRLFISHQLVLTDSLAAEYRSSVHMPVFVEVLSRLARYLPAEVQLEPRQLEFVVQQAIAPGRICKYKYFAELAVRYLVKKDQLAELSEFVLTVMEAARKLDLISMAAVFESIGVLCRLNVVSFTQRHMVETVRLVQDFLSSPGDDVDAEEDDEDVWLPDNDVTSLCWAKIAALRCLAQIYSSKQAAVHSGKTFSSLAANLLQIIKQDGEVVGGQSGSTRNGFKTRFRLEAGLCVLKLESRGAFHKVPLSHRIRTLAMLVQDPCYEIRELFMQTYQKYLHNLRLGVQYMTLLFMAAFEPEEELEHSMKRSAVAIINILRRDNCTALFPERILWWLVHILAHHPDFGTTGEELQLTSRYITFYLDLVATAENVSYLFEITNTMKTVEDLAGDPNNTYVLSELTQDLIRKKCNAHSWSIATFPGVVGYPKELYRLLDSDTARHVSHTVFLSKPPAKPNVTVIQPRTKNVNVAAGDDESSADDDQVVQPVRAKNKAALAATTSEAPVPARVTRASKRRLQE